MSLRYADTSLPDLLGRPSLLICRPSLRYAVNEPPPYRIAFYKSWFSCVMKNVKKMFLDIMA